MNKRPLVAHPNAVVSLDTTDPDYVTLVPPGGAKYLSRRLLQENEQRMAMKRAREGDMEMPRRVPVPLVVDDEAEESGDASSTSASVDEEIEEEEEEEEDEEEEDEEDWEPDEHDIDRNYSAQRDMFHDLLEQKDEIERKIVLMKLKYPTLAGSLFGR